MTSDQIMSLTGQVKAEVKVKQVFRDVVLLILSLAKRNLNLGFIL